MKTITLTNVFTGKAAAADVVSQSAGKLIVRVPPMQEPITLYRRCGDHADNCWFAEDRYGWRYLFHNS